jgi:hypothetical protein
VNFKNWLKKRPAWLRGGIYGILVCLVLFVFYLLIYMPVLNSIYGGSLPDYSLTLPTLTGHTFVFLSHFAIEGSSLTQAFCPPVKEQCYSWTAEELDNCVPWQLETGEQGCCDGLDLVPEESCRNKVEIFATIFSLFWIFALYFLIGALIIHFKQIKKSNR